jgi:hypothetical protein
VEGAWKITLKTGRKEGENCRFLPVWENFRLLIEQKWGKTNRGFLFLFLFYNMENMVPLAAALPTLPCPTCKIYPLSAKDLEKDTQCSYCRHNAKKKAERKVVCPFLSFLLCVW